MYKKNVVPECFCKRSLFGKKMHGNMIHFSSSPTDP